jgi:sugar transferase (PEP-CTERM/EpsH1 system associated)
VRVLYLCHRIPYPPDKGDKIRAFHQLRAMGERHEVDLFTLADHPGDAAHGAALEKYCRRVTVAELNPRWSRLRSLRFLFTEKPLTVPYFHSPKLDTAVRKALSERSYDRIFVYCSAMAQYVDRVDSIPIVTDLVDVDSDKWTQYAGFTRFPLSAVYRREGRLLREYERRVCERSACVLVSTEREGELARQISGSAPVQVIPNGVDTDYFRPGPTASHSDRPAIVFTGDMSYFPNAAAVRYFAREVLPLIQESLPAVRFLIVGRNPGSQVRDLQKLAGVEVTGFVPDVREYLGQAQVSVAPFSIAAGIQNKILEAMAFGLPVVATKRAVQGLSSQVAAAVDTANTVLEMAAMVLRLLRCPELARKKGAEGRERVATNYKWGEALERLLALLENPSLADVAMTKVH